MTLRLCTALAIFSIAGLVSCAGSDDKSYIDKSVVPENSTVSNGAQPQNVDSTAPANSIAPATTAPGSITIPGSNTIGTNQQIQQMQPLTINPQGQPTQSNIVTTTQQQLQPTAPGMNPPHGQPNHRCDIAVGAPLNSKPAANGASQPNVVTTQQPAANNVTVTQQPSKPTAPGMNPPHGEPGHRCDIAVGAPLNSKPAPPPATAGASDVKTAVPPLLAPVKPDSSKN